MRRLLASLSAAALLLYDRVGDGRDRAIEWSSLQLPGRPGDLAERATPLRREPRLRRSPLPDLQASLFIEYLLARPDLADRVGIEV